MAVAAHAASPMEMTMSTVWITVNDVVWSSTMMPIPRISQKMTVQARNTASTRCGDRRQRVGPAPPHQGHHGHAEREEDHGVPGPQHLTAG